MQKHHRIQFPKAESSDLNQDQSYFYLQESGKQRKIRFHDYNEIYKIPGLYEQLFYDRLKCSSPIKVTSILEAAVRQSQDNFSELRVLDLGAGNGMMGEELKTLTGPVRVDRGSAPLAVSLTLAGADVSIAWGEDPCILPKACKNDAEIAGTRDAHLTDGVAMVEFLAWLDAEAPKGKLTEIHIHNIAS